MKEGHKISDVAEKTGYVNANVFIRNFKKYTGITPGQYRESMDLEYFNNERRLSI